MLACSGAEVETISPEAPPAPGVTGGAPAGHGTGGEHPPAAPTTVIGGADGTTAIQLQYVGVSPLYRGYFATEEWVTTLGAGLGPCVSDTADIVVSYDTEHRIGRILLSTTADELGCTPTLVDGKTVDLTPLVPIGKALARYRDTVAAERDIRVASFRAGVRLLHNTDLCEIYIGGQFPPDGTTFSSCVSIAGHEHCIADRNEPITALPLTRATARALKSCLQQ